VHQGALFTTDWLTEGITATPQWQALDDARITQLWAQSRHLLDELLKRKNPTEADTEQKLIYPLLGMLGWDHISVQQNLTIRGRKDVPDALLFPDADADATASGLEPWQRFRHGSALVEAKRWGRPLDRQGTGDQGVPSTQIMHYLQRASVITEGRMLWGILTNGRNWRLYYQNALSVAEDFFEIDLGKLFGLPGCTPELFDDGMSPEHAFRLFVLAFGREAFLPTEQGRSFHLIALDETKRWEERVRKDLAETVFSNVFPKLIAAIPLADPNRPAEINAAYAEEVRSSALFLLYRLLFILYAEDRNLLPDETGPYSPYCLTRLRQEIEQLDNEGRKPLERSHAYWSRLETIFGAIAEGDDSLGIPPYNGGLFDAAESPLLSRIRLPDTVLAEVILALSHRREDGRLRYINYRDLSVQQLGSIYESILEYGVEPDLEARSVKPRADNQARHRSGSYYTPEPLVSLIIEKTVGPVVAEKRAAFEAAHGQGLKGAELAQHDPAMALLSLRIVDPAMGSGHFLVSLVDWLSDKVLTAIGDAEEIAGDSYASPLVQNIAGLREAILANARDHGWPIVEDQLEDRHIVRRMVLKRCIHGVDLNRMAVELAKVSLWLHSFTVGAPLSFLDHHLRCGNSVLGGWVRPTMDWLQARGSLIANNHLAPLANVVRHMETIEGLTDTDLTEVHQSKQLFGTVAESSRPLNALLSLVKADELMGVLETNVKRPRETAAAIRADGDKRIAAMPEKTDKEKAAKAKEIERIDRAVTRAAEAERKFDRAEALKLVFEGSFGDPSRIASGDLAIMDGDSDDGAQASLMPEVRPDDRRRTMASGIIGDALGHVAQQNFFNWEIAFPGVWAELSSNARTGGFDAVIGNPPYVRQEEISAIKPALAKSFSTYAGTADLYVYFYEQGIKLLRPGGRMGYVVTNKWLKTGYAEELRRLFAEDVWIEFLADFGHAKHLFPDADVMPCVISVRKPLGYVVPEEFDLAVIPRDEVPREGLALAVDAATYRASRSDLTAEPWVLEPPDVAALLRKIRERGVLLSEYAGVNPLYGIKTGLNEAFLIDTPTRDQLVRDDPAAADIIKPYLRGQDIGRWSPEWAGLWMIVMKSSSDHAWPWAGAASESEAEAIFSKTYPSIYRRFKGLESYIEDDKPKGLRHRQDQGRFWWELRPCAYYDDFSKPKFVWQMIQYYPNYAWDESGFFTNNKAYSLPSSSYDLMAIKSSPLAWWISWRHYPHMKDEALSNDANKFLSFPVGEKTAKFAGEISDLGQKSMTELIGIKNSDQMLADWLSVEMGLSAVPITLRQASLLDSDDFVAAVRAALPRRQSLTPTQLRQVRDAFAETAEPARTARGELLAHERALAAMVERAYGLTEEEVALMWRTAPPRMPLPPPFG
jgi:hypothetical protein